MTDRVHPPGTVLDGDGNPVTVTEPRRVWSGRTTVDPDGILYALGAPEVVDDLTAELAEARLALGALALEVGVDVDWPADAHVADIVRRIVERLPDPHERRHVDPDDE